jgi:hypothetical protein
MHANGIAARKWSLLQSIARALALVGAFTVPFVMMASLVFINQEYHPFGPGGLGNAWWIGITLFGFLLLMTPRELRRYAIYVFIVYFPVMASLLLYLAMVIGIGFYQGP